MKKILIIISIIILLLIINNISFKKDIKINNNFGENNKAIEASKTNF